MTVGSVVPLLKGASAGRLRAASTYAMTPIMQPGKNAFHSLPSLVFFFVEITTVFSNYPKRCRYAHANEENGINDWRQVKTRNLLFLLLITVMREIKTTQIRENSLCVNQNRDTIQQNEIIISKVFQIRD